MGVRNKFRIGLLSVMIVSMVLSGALVRAQEAQPDARVMAQVMLRLRAAPSTESEILAILDPETALTVLGMSLDRQWLHVETPGGQIGWVFLEYVDVLIDLDTAFPDGAGYIRLPPRVVEHIQQVYVAGRMQGNRPNVFAKVGDSITESILTLNPVGDGIYSLGEYAYLQDAITFYASGETGEGENSFNRLSRAAKVGWTTYGVLDPEAGNPADCKPGEMPLLCEYRLIQPSAALILLGTNDVGGVGAGAYRENLSRIVELTEARGIIPILTTIPLRADYEARVQEFNNIVVAVADEYTIPLVDYGGAMQALGDSGLDLDGVHPSVPPRGFNGAADFSADNLYYGYVLRNLTALQMLDAVWRATAG